MRTIFTTFFCFITLAGAVAQLPGWNFEEWKVLSIEKPEKANFTIYDEGEIFKNAGLLQKTTDASNGLYAIKLVSNGSKNFAYVLYGEAGEGGPEGGIPFADNPTQVTISYKCTMAVGDSAQIWVWLYNQGNVISENFFKIGGNQQSYRDTTFTLASYTLMPDSLMFAFTSADPFKGEISTLGNEIYFDNVRFNGTNNLQIPDNSFENWVLFQQDYTDAMFEIDAIVTKTNDAYSRDYAVKITTTDVEWYASENSLSLRNNLTLWGTWEKGNLPILQRKDTLALYYKLIPSPGVIDTAMAMIKFFKDGQEVINYGNRLYMTNEYILGEVPFDLDNTHFGGSVSADSLTVILVSSQWPNVGKPEHVNLEGTSLYVDHIYFKSQGYKQKGIADVNGTVFPKDTIIIKNEPVTFTIKPNNGFTVNTATYNSSDVLGSLISSGNNFTYSIPNVQAPGNLDVSFKTTTGIENLGISPGITFGPNPATKSITLNGINKEYTLEIISNTGKSILKKIIYNNTPVDISALAKGIYLVKIDNKLQGKLIKQ